MSQLDDLLALRPLAHDTLEAWWPEAQRIRTHATLAADRALLGGVLADRAGFAFVAGYQAALDVLVGPGDGLTSLCATEAGGNRPRDIATRLAETAPGTFELTGDKTWATGGPLAARLIVIATTGMGADDKPVLRAVRVRADAPGVTITPSSAPFVPEIPHARISLAHVAVTAADVLPGDGYADYLRPFRTIEDAHVHAAVASYLIGVARRIGVARERVEELLATALALRAVAQLDPKSPATHVALAGALAQLAQLVAAIEAHWATAPDPEWERWQRDRALMRVASAARAARRDKAWTQLG